ncbi:hypothetical protein N0V90_011213 [Kalmusia sp. IMI 367209]|nr:hypothetical protein N0V90_011213 [Kalmusia sp. IMI 367209]
MYISTPLVTVLTAAGIAQALQLSDITITVAEKRGLASKLLEGIFQRKDSCPPVWKDISSTLTQQFLADGQCTDAARAAIRSAFHDCFNGACDGSLILANECSNSENRGLERLCGNLGSLAQQKNVGVADLIQFAAGNLSICLPSPIRFLNKVTAHAIKTCPGGPTVPAKVGRKDSSTAAPLGILPTGRESATELIARFAHKGFSAVDLAALIGAHTAARNRVTVPEKVDLTMDSTPGVWDTKYYTETINGNAPVTIPSDKNMASNLVTGVPMKSFALSQGAWSAAFVPAMMKMSMLGVNGVMLTDCTNALPRGSSKRDVKRSGMFERLGW